MIEEARLYQLVQRARADAAIECPFTGLPMSFNGCIEVLCRRPCEGFNRQAEAVETIEDVLTSGVLEILEEEEHGKKIPG